MTKPRKLLERLQQGAYQNVAFDDFVALVQAFGFRLHRITGSHHVYYHRRATRPLSIQPRRGNAKDYQIRQFLRMVEEFDLSFEDGAS